MDENEDDELVFSVGLNITFVSTICVLIITLFALLLHKWVAVVFLLILAAQAFQSLFTQYVKAVGQVKLFAANGIFVTLVTTLADIVLLVFFHTGLIGYLAAILIANVCSNVLLVVYAKLPLRFSVLSKSKELTRRMIGYSAPLIPNSVAWWTTSTISRYFIVAFLGSAANGIFAVSNRIPSMLNVVSSIFFQSWQLSAIEEFNSKDNGKFYSNVFKAYFKIMFLGTSMILTILKPLMHFLVSAQYYTAWEYIPLLLVSVTYSSFASFFGQFYIAAKRTTGVLTSTIVAGIVNVVLNLLLIPQVGLMGAAIASTISYIILWLLRWIDTRKIIFLNIQYLPLILNNILVAIQIVCLFYFSAKVSFMTMCVISIISLFLNGKELFSIVSKRIRIH